MTVITSCLLTVQLTLCLLGTDTGHYVGILSNDGSPTTYILHAALQHCSDLLAERPPTSIEYLVYQSILNMNTFSSISCE